MSGQKKFVPFLSCFVDGAGAQSFEAVIAISRLGGQTAYRKLRHWMLKSPLPYLRYQATWGVSHLSDKDSAFTELVSVAIDEKEYPEIRGEAIEGMACRLHGDRRKVRHSRISVTRRP